MNLRKGLGILGLAALTGLLACQGKGSSSSDLKIHNGFSVQINDAGPEGTATVGIIGKFPLNPSEVYYCSATLIASDLLLTAAHCVDATANISAFFGLDLTQPANGVLIPISASAVDPNYAPIQGSEEIVPDDIALFKLATPAPAGYEPVPVLTDDSSLYAGETVRLAGYGSTDNVNGAGTLRYVDSTLNSEDAENRLIVEDSQERAACKGDSGGPLYVSVSGTWYVAGALSGGPDPCGTENSYTSTAAFADFIQTTQL